MSHELSRLNGQGLVPAFPGLSAQSIPGNPDVERETRRLLLQYSAGSLSKITSTPAFSSNMNLKNINNDVQDARSRQAPQTETSRPRASPQSSSRPAPLSSNSKASRPSTPSTSVSQSIAPASGNQFRAYPRAPSQINSPQSVISISSSRDTSPDNQDRQRDLRASVAISNASRNVRPSKSTSPRSSRSISPTIEQGHVRRSNRNRLRINDYYADPWGLNCPTSEDSGTNVEATLEPKTHPPQEPCRVLPRANIQKLLYGRELGARNHRHIVNDVVSDLRPWKSWQGASGDLLVLAWSPDGTQFAAGAAAKSDEHNMVYNKPKNLLFGDLQSNRLKEIAGHWVPRPTSSTVDDPRLFMTVNNMQWVEDRLYTASFDKTVKIWKIDPLSNISCAHTLQHESRVATMSVSGFDPKILATGTESIQVWDTRDPENLTSTLLPLDRDTRHRQNTELSSTALAWGQSPSTREFLAGGLAEQGEDLVYKGHLGLWRAGESGYENVRFASSCHNIFDIKWHSSLPIFATANPEDPHHARSKGIGTTTKSLVKLFSLVHDLSRRLPSYMEFSCPALDVNEVSFCPIDSYGTYVTASCTDGNTYVWDTRMGDRILHELRHGQPLNPIDDQRPREAADVGVRVALWGSSLDQFYTGASDGVLKRWDIRRSSEDVLVENVATFDEEIMCGAFTADQTHLLIGGSGGGVHVLSSGSCSDSKSTSFDFEHAPEPDTADSGIAAGMELVSSGQLVRHPVFGMGQGPSYAGPFASWVRDVGQDIPVDRIGQLSLLKIHQDQQLDGPPPEERPELDANQQQDLRRRRELAKMRNQGVHIIQPEAHDDVSGLLSGVASLTRPPSLEQKQKAEKRKRRSELKSETHGEANRQGQVERINRKKKKRESSLVIIDTGAVDLTLDSESEVDKLLQTLEEDNWFPASGDLDPNFQNEVV